MTFDPVLSAICPFCGHPVSPDNHETYRRVVGWEIKAGVRASGKHGGSDITLREPLDEYAHKQCITAEKNGVSANQHSLL